ncbi:ATPase [Mesorhizobium sp. LSJC285A00]|uniref:AAA family ATPase n=1 Tax=unclassified Mesorhizobium TaxID=325217 RepID=UPI0003CF1386|nr:MULTISPECIES: ATP-binding protein [unclassified Mesorhizobium]ESW64227.1 ATPase [Mesorhizobium sp. LSJC285A00]ESY08055.1 ATPase [Mesorhizobium sp. LNJC399B00]WJI71384.1 ATP-binding protein [Mesorhizobium sp. C399B]
MAISKNDVLELLDAALAADYTRVRRIGGKIAQSLSKEDADAAKEIRALIRKKGVPLRASGYVETLPVDVKSRLPLVEEQVLPSTPIFLDGANRSTFQAFLDDVKNVDILINEGLSTRLSMLISGPPGTGKTLLAGHIASHLDMPLYVVRLDSVISSLLGDTSKNIRNVFEFVPNQRGVLFLDEMDAVAKLRDDHHELGELKRVVNTVIQGLDSLDDHAVVIGATNHAQLLDAAIWRRFPYKIELSAPNEAIREDLWRYFLPQDDASIPAILARISNGLNGADIQNLALATRRQALLDNHDLDLAAAAWSIIQTKNGRVVLPERNGLSTEQKKSLSATLTREGRASGADVARILGVSRQAVSAYLKEERDAN